VANILIQADAEAEYEAALRWYHQRSARAADGFEAAFEDALALIVVNPEFCPLCDDRHRYCLMRRYPYSVIYRVDGGTIRVIAVAHSSRLPRYWADRR
jgi:plasmid stabilization system protein ParE